MGKAAVTGVPVWTRPVSWLQAVEFYGYVQDPTRLCTAQPETRVMWDRCVHRGMPTHPCTPTRRRGERRVILAWALAWVADTEPGLEHILRHWGAGACGPTPEELQAWAPDSRKVWRTRWADTSADLLSIERFQVRCMGYMTIPNEQIRTMSDAVRILVVLNQLWPFLYGGIEPPMNWWPYIDLADCIVRATDLEQLVASDRFWQGFGAWCHAWERQCP